MADAVTSLPAFRSHAEAAEGVVELDTHAPPPAFPIRLRLLRASIRILGVGSCGASAGDITSSFTGRRTQSASGDDSSRFSSFRIRNRDGPFLPFPSMDEYLMGGCRQYMWYFCRAPHLDKLSLHRRGFQLGLLTGLSWKHRPDWTTAFRSATRSRNRGWGRSDDWLPSHAARRGRDRSLSARNIRCSFPRHIGSDGELHL